MKLDLYDINEFIEKNQCLPVTSRFYINANDGPDEDGLFSTTIFGKFGSENRKYRFGYIDLKRKFFHPLVYVTIYGMLRSLPQILAGEKYCTLSVDGNIKFVDDPEQGETGIDFFVNNWKKIRWTKVDEENRSREKKEDLLDLIDINMIFVDKFLVIPAMFRDINFSTVSASSQKIKVDGINALYIKLINSTQSDSITFTNSYLTQSSVQRTLVDIYTELTKKISGKHGIIRQAIMGKSVDYSTIGVISCSRMESNTFDKQQVKFNEIGVPLVMCIALFYPFVVKYLEDYFHTFEQSSSIVIGEDKRFDLPETVYNNLNSETIKKLIDGYVKDKTHIVRTRSFGIEGFGKERLTQTTRSFGGVEREFTLTDLFFEACADIVHNKHVLVTRYPVTGPESVIVCRIVLLSTEKTIDISESGNKRLTNYPYLPTDNKGNILVHDVNWIDTYVPNISFLASLGGDFDGDTIRVIGLFSSEANLEAERVMTTPLNYLDPVGNFTRGINREGALSMYMLTK